MLNFYVWLPPPMFETLSNLGQLLLARNFIVTCVQRALSISIKGYISIPLTWNLCFSNSVPSVRVKRGCAYFTELMVKEIRMTLHKQ